ERTPSSGWSQCPPGTMHRLRGVRRLFMRKPATMPSAAEALPGRADPIPTARVHFVNGHPLKPPYPAGLEQAVFGLGCFWGAERKFWELGEGIHVTAAGYAGGY